MRAFVMVKNVMKARVAAGRAFTVPVALDDGSQRRSRLPLPLNEHPDFCGWSGDCRRAPGKSGRPQS